MRGHDEYYRRKQQPPFPIVEKLFAYKQGKTGQKKQHRGPIAMMFDKAM